MSLYFRSGALRSSQLRLTHTTVQLRSRRFASTFSVDNPYTGEEYVKVARASDSDAARSVAKASEVFKSFRSSKLDDRIALCRQVMKQFQKSKEQIAKDITGQMGKPLKQALGEVDGMLSRADALIQLAPRALATEQLSPVTDSAAMKKITKEPIGPVLLLSPWNYPLLCTINSTFHAVLAGNPIIIKHSDRSPLVAEAFEKAFLEAGAPAGLVQAVHADHALVSRMIANPDIAYVSFTGSVGGGRAVYKAVADRFIDVGLELGGKDGAYVARDADVKKAAAGIVDGAIYNAGQSCCAVERVYVHRDLYDPFVQECVKLAKEYVLGNPLSESTSLGPMAQPQAPAFLKKQVDEAVQKGASLLFGGKPTKSAEGKGRFFEPTVIAGCDHSMNVMVDESFGPIVAIHKPVASDEEAVKLINDSPYGLTASVWSSNPQKAEHLCQQLNVGTVYLNRCDFLDPLLPWSGRKDSGKGIGLSHFGFAPFFRTKGYNFKNQI